MIPDDEERLVILRFTEQETIKAFYQFLQNSEFMENFSGVKNGDEKKEEDEDNDSGTLWSDWGMDDYDGAAEEGPGSFRVVQR